MAEISAFLRTDFKAVDKRDAVRSVMGYLTGNTSKVPVIMDGERPFGIVNERALMGSRLDLNAGIHKYTLPTRALPMGAHEGLARAKLAEFRAAYLPVENAEGGLAGYVRAIDLAREGLHDMSAADVAVPVTMLSPESTLGDALHAFGREYVEVLPVVQGGKVVGALHRRDVLNVEQNAADRGRKDTIGEQPSLFEEAIAGFVDDNPSYASPDTTASALLPQLEDAGYAFVRGPEGSFMGVVTEETLLRAG